MREAAAPLPDLVVEHDEERLTLAKKLHELFRVKLLHCCIPRGHRAQGSKREQHTQRHGLQQSDKLVAVFDDIY